MLMIINVFMWSSECKEETFSWIVASTVPIRASWGSARPWRGSSCPAFIYRFHGPGSSYVPAVTSLPCGIGLIPPRFTIPPLTGSFQCPRERVNIRELPTSLKLKETWSIQIGSLSDNCAMLLHDAITDLGWWLGPFKNAALIREVL
jgi:hypothetical protein